MVRFLILWRESRRIRRQLADLDNPRDDNSLGRILRAYHEDRKLDIEALELKMGESVLREVPRINRHLPLLKIIAAVAPLMGLLGTVTGMIITFQAITLFGAGDPRLMAGGISQALITRPAYGYSVWLMKSRALIKKRSPTGTSYYHC